MGAKLHSLNTIRHIELVDVLLKPKGITNPSHKPCFILKAGFLSAFFLDPNLMISRFQSVVKHLACCH